MLLSELTETKRRRHPVGLNIVAHDRSAGAGVQVPSPLGDLSFRFSRSTMLPDVLAPGRHQHLRPKGPWIFQVFFDPEKKRTIPEKDQTELLGQ